MAKHNILGKNGEKIAGQGSDERGNLYGDLLFRYIPGSDAGIHSDFHGADGDYSAADRRHPVHVVSDQGEKTRHDFHHERDHGTSDAVDGHGLLAAYHQHHHGRRSGADL